MRDVIPTLASLDLDLARDAVAVALQESAGSGELHIVAGQLALRGGAFEDAEQQFRAALALATPGGEAGAGLAYALWRLGRSADALVALRTAGSTTIPEPFEVETLRGQILLARGDCDGALAALEASRAEGMLHAVVRARAAIRCGRLEAAEQAADSIRSGGAHAALFRFMARAQQDGHRARDELLAEAARLREAGKATEWPAMAVLYYCGEASEDRMLSEMAKPTHAGTDGEAAFYLGMAKRMGLRDGIPTRDGVDHEKAIELLQRAARVLDPVHDESVLALLELGLAGR